MNAAITNVLDGDLLYYGKPFVLKGYAIGGKGSRVIRVEVSTDNERWDPARIVETEKSERRDNSSNWAWAFWEFDVPDGITSTEMMISVRAWDEGMNTMPDHPYWNSFGYMNNSVFRILVKAIVPKTGLENYNPEN